MTLKLADAGADQTVAAAGAIQSHGLVVAPGTAAYSTAAAHIATLESNAHIQKMIASALRLEAARLGHDTMTVGKPSAHFYARITLEDNGAESVGGQEICSKSSLILRLAAGVGSWWPAAECRSLRCS